MDAVDGLDLILAKKTENSHRKKGNLDYSSIPVKAKLCTFLEDSIPFESPICARDTVKAIFSLVPEIEWELGTFNVSSAFFQGDTPERDKRLMLARGFLKRKREPIKKSLTLGWIKKNCILLLVYLTTREVLSLD